jgi:hypothetical protein
MIKPLNKDLIKNPTEIEPSLKGLAITQISMEKRMIHLRV